MDFVNKASAQVLDLFRTMSPGARITTALLLAIVVISLGFLLRFEGDVAEDYLFGAEVLTQREIDTMAAAFGKAGLNGFRVENHRVRVPRTQRHTYLAALVEANALPEHPGTASEEVFRSTNPLEPRDVRELKTRRAKERDIESTIRKLTGIEEAFVSMEEINQGGFPPRKEKRALVSVRAVGKAQLDEPLVRAIQKAVAYGGGVEDANVTVLDLNSNVAYAGKGAEGRPFGEENAYSEALARYERLYREKIEELLSMIPGVRIDVYVDLDKNLTTRTTTQKFEQPVPVRTTDYQKDSSTSVPLSGGRPGAAANAVGNTPQVVTASSATESKVLETRTEADNLAGTTHEFVEQAGLVPRYVKAAIYVPRSYFEKVWREENATGDGSPPTAPDRAALKTIESKVIQDIEDTVAALLPEPAPGVDKFPRISVKTFTETPLASPVGPTMAETASAWFQAHWQTLGMFLLTLFGLLLFRGMLKGKPPVAVPTASAPVQSQAERLAALEEDVEEEEEEDDYANSLKARFQHSGRSLRDELGELVKEDPDAAANVLQHWIGDAA